jgi:hypothetical protein
LPAEPASRKKMERDSEEIKEPEMDMLSFSTCSSSLKKNLPLFSEEFQGRSGSLLLFIL